MEIKQEFGTWLGAKRQSMDLSTYNFSPIDASTINRIENGKSQARFHNAMEILRVLNVDFPEFIETFLGIEQGEVKAIQTKIEDTIRENKEVGTLVDDPPNLTFDDLLLLIKFYKRGHQLVTWLIGVSAMRLSSYYDRAWSRFPLDEITDGEYKTHAEQLGEWLTYQHNGHHKNPFNIEWKQLRLDQVLGYKEQEHKPILDAFSRREVVTPDDVALIGRKIYGQNSKEIPFKNNEMSKKFNRERLLLDNLLQICVYYSEEDAIKVLNLFWYAYSLDPMISSAHPHALSNELKHLKNVSSLLITLWRWLIYTNDYEGINIFKNVLDTLRKRGESPSLDK